jgi:hypothetical protein
VFYFNSLAVNSFVYYDLAGTTLFNGDFKWYRAIYLAQTYALLIANTGQILEMYDCSTTTTTTTTTTAPTYYYESIICGTATLRTLKIQSFDPLPLGTTVKDSTNICSVLDSVISPAVEDAIIWYSYGSCFECLSSIPTTTTTTTTSTTTTTTSTTTTTTAPPLTALILSSNVNSADVCTVLNIQTFYVNGAIGIPGNDIFVDLLGSSPAPAAWYLQIITNIAYQWNGSDWTGGSISC